MDGWSSPESEALPEGLADFVKPELQPGERLLWAAKAQPHPPKATGFPLPSLLVTLTAFGVSLASFYAIFGPPRPRFMSVEGLLIGSGIVSFIVGLVSGIVFLNGLWSPNDHAGKTYALTDSRAIIWVPVQGSTGVEVHAVLRGSIKAIHRLEYPDGSGDVKFDYPMGEYRHGASGFEGVTQVRYVEDLTRRTLIDPSRTLTS